MNIKYQFIQFWCFCVYLYIFTYISNFVISIYFSIRIELFIIWIWFEYCCKRFFMRFWKQYKIYFNKYFKIYKSAKTILNNFFFTHNSTKQKHPDWVFQPTFTIHKSINIFVMNMEYVFLWQFYFICTI